MSQAVLRPNLTKKFQWEVSQIADKECSLAPLYRWFKCKLKPPKNCITNQLDLVEIELTRIHAVLAKIHGLRHGPCMHPCPNLDLLVIGQNVFTTARFNICIDAMKKNSNCSTLELLTQSISKMSPVPSPLKIF